MAKRNNRTSASIKTNGSELDMQTWYQDNLNPILFEIETIIDKDEDLDPSIKYWYHAFRQNTFVLAKILLYKHAYYQVAMTTRLLLEIACDVSFIKDNPENIKNLTKIQNEIAKKQEDEPNNYLYSDSIKDSKNIFLYIDGNKKQKTTKERIKLVDDDLISLYDFLCRYSHFNHMTTIWEGNKDTDSARLKDALLLFQYYPTLFRIIISAIGELGNIQALKDYDYKQIEKIFDDTINWQI